MKQILISLVVLIVVFLVWPAKIDAVKYIPPIDQGFIAGFEVNDKLDLAEILPLREGFGPEDVAVDAAGYIYGGLQDGRIVRLSADGTQQETFASLTGGRPLGLHFDAQGNLIVADAWKGLLSLSSDGTVTTLATEHNNRTFKFTNDLDIARDGKIYFSDASDSYNQPDYRLDLLEGQAHGRLLVYDPATDKTDLLLDNLYFANGVALSQNEDFVLVNETARYRITRYWLTGDKAGSHDVFIDNLPGFPDGLSSNRQGTFWLAIPSPRNPLMDRIHPVPWMKGLISKLPKFMQPSAIKTGSIIALNENGRVLGAMHDRDGEPVYMVTSVQQKGDVLYLGSLEAPQIVRVPVSSF